MPLNQDFNTDPDVGECKITLLKQFRSAINDIIQPQHDDEFLLRFLAARNFDVAKAEKMIRESFKFKKKIQAENLISSGFEIHELFRNHCPTEFVCFDKIGNLIRIFHGGICDFKGLSHSYTVVELVRFIMYILESDLHRIKQRRLENLPCSGLSTYLIDLHNFTFRQFCDKTVINAGAQLITMYQDNYPETLQTAYFIRAPKYFTWVFNLFKPFIDERTLRKIQIYSNDDWKAEVSRNVDKNLLPTNYGGFLPDPFSDHEKIQSMKVPVENYLKGSSCFKSTDPGVKIMTIDKRSYRDVKIMIKKPNSTIKWVFQVTDYNIKFGIFFRSCHHMDSKNFPPEVMIPVDLTESQIIPERGEIICEKAGQYTLRFDNSYSWLTKKEILYKIDTELPLGEIMEE